MKGNKYTNSEVKLASIQPLHIITNWNKMEKIEEIKRREVSLNINEWYKKNIKK